jgi:MFS family permease
MTDDRERRTSRDRRLGDIETREADVEAPTGEIVHGGGTFASFRHRDYTLFWSGAFVSNIGTWMQNYALGLVVYSFRSSELDLGIVSFLSGIPVLFLALWAGGLADRVDRKRLIIRTQAVLLVQAAALGWL